MYTPPQHAHIPASHGAQSQACGLSTGAECTGRVCACHSVVQTCWRVGPVPHSDVCAVLSCVVQSVHTLVMGCARVAQCGCAVWSCDSQRLLPATNQMSARKGVECLKCLSASTAKRRSFKTHVLRQWPSTQAPHRPPSRIRTAILGLRQGM
jgi:hypothetical protein